jgi:N-acyl-D-amino-acid deacylase
MKCRFGLLIGSLVFLLALSVNAETYDVVIANGRVVDGTGNPAFFADVAISKGRIVKVGRVTGKARTRIDAKGLIVAPGFIDVHTHADDVAEMPKAENFVRMGVTTIVAGNCGSSTLDMAKLFREVERTNVAVNVASLVGHNSVRQKAMGGDFDRPPTPEELEQMRALVRQAMKDGAVGLSTGLIYQPGVFSHTDEIVELAKVAAAYDGIYTSHMRHEDDRIYQALDGSSMSRGAPTSGPRYPTSSWPAPPPGDKRTGCWPTSRKREPKGWTSPRTNTLTRLRARA